MNQSMRDISSAVCLVVSDFRCWSAEFETIGIKSSYALELEHGRNSFAVCLLFSNSVYNRLDAIHLDCLSWSKKVIYGFFTSEFWCWSADFGPISALVEGRGPPSTFSGRSSEVDRYPEYWGHAISCRLQWLCLRSFFCKSKSENAVAEQSRHEGELCPTWQYSTPKRKAHIRNVRSSLPRWIVSAAQGQAFDGSAGFAFKTGSWTICQKMGTHCTD
jgi:hypothetical protein